MLFARQRQPKARNEPIGLHGGVMSTTTKCARFQKELRSSNANYLGKPRIHEIAKLQNRRGGIVKSKLFHLFIIVVAVAAVSAQQNRSTQFKNLNVNFMLRGYFYAGSRIEDKNALGGFGPSENFSKTIDANANVPANTVSLIALSEEETVFAKEFIGIKVRLINTTGERIAFPASDSRLDIVQEAIDRDGKWKPIEYLPSSWCGNSYHTVFLGPNEYWEFAAAKYNGKFKTKLRFRLQSPKLERTEFIYSNEFDGSVNPKQFTVEQGHKPTSIMDPYNN